MADGGHEAGEGVGPAQGVVAEVIERRCAFVGVGGLERAEPVELVLLLGVVGRGAAR